MNVIPETRLGLLDIYNNIPYIKNENYIKDSESYLIRIFEGNWNERKSNPQDTWSLILLK